MHLLGSISIQDGIFFFLLYAFFQELGGIIPRETLLWKLKLLRSGAAYANSRIHAVQAEVLVLAR